MLETLRELLRAHELLYMLAWREIRARYKQSVMGALWALLMPLVIVFSGSLIRFAFATVSGTEVRLEDITALAVKSVPYALMAASIRFGTSSLVANANLLTKIYMPRLVFPVAAVLSQLFDFAVAAAVLTVLALVARVGISIQLLWLPLLLAGFLLLALGSAIMLSAASLFFRDVKYLVEVLLTFAIFFTPVFYESKMLGRWAPAVLLNPISPLLEGVSATVIGHRPPDLAWLSYSLVFGLLLGVASIALFRKLEPFFAESV
jgi:ABC-type polysaccharide/polyol phosphate export permease